MIGAGNPMGFSHSIGVDVALERGKDPWRPNAFYFAVRDASLRIAEADRRVERWVTYFRKKHDELQGDTWTNGRAPQSRLSGSGTSSTVLDA